MVTCFACKTRMAGHRWTIAMQFGHHEVERWLVKKGGGAVTAGPVGMEHVISNCQSISQ